MNFDHLCMGCMNELCGEEQCSKCGYHIDSPQISPYLPLKTIIGGKYIVGKVMSYNSEGITYIAYDADRKSAVLLREFLPEGLAIRDDNGINVKVFEHKKERYNSLLGEFVGLWRNLARVRGFSALIPVIDIVEENNTVYAITEHIESISLREFLLISKTGYLNWEKANQLFMPVLSLLSCLHEIGIVHYGISPDTLLVGRDGKLRLSGFSIKEYRVAQEDIVPEIFDGYASLEQYKNSFARGAWSDVYAFCAVIYRSLVGSVPQEAISRSTSDKLIIPARYAEIIPAYVINALMNGLQIDPRDRTRNIESLREELSATPSNVASSYSGVKISNEEKKEKVVPVTVTTEDDSPVGTILKTFLVILGVGLVIISGLLIGSKLIKSPETQPVESTTESTELVEVADFVNESFDTIAQNTVQNQRFTIKSEYEYHPEIKKGYIVSQSIKPGKKVPMGTEIVFVVSKGPEYVIVPTVKDMTLEEAKAKLEELGFKVEVIEKLNDGEQIENTVAVVSPEEGSSQVKGSSITSEVWGAAPEEDDGWGSGYDTDLSPGFGFGDLFDLF